MGGCVLLLILRFAFQAAPPPPPFLVRDFFLVLGRRPPPPGPGTPQGSPRDLPGIAQGPPREPQGSLKPISFRGRGASQLWFIWVLVVFGCWLSCFVFFFRGDSENRRIRWTADKWMLGRHLEPRIRFRNQLESSNTAFGTLN